MCLLAGTHSINPRGDDIGKINNLLLGSEYPQRDREATKNDSVEGGTGFANLDAKMNGLSPGLYVLGAVPSLGKTTFLSQMADQIAASGHDVIYFSLEQSEQQLIANCIARFDAIQHWNKRKSFAGAKNAMQVEEADNAFYSEHIAPHKITKYCGYDTSADDIVDAIQWARENKFQNADKPPVVIVDYLQVLNPPNNKQQMRDAVDANIQRLRDCQKKQGIVLWLISSFNRSSYYKPVTMESFKETGGIEFTADFIAGLQLDEVNDAADIKDYTSAQIKFKDKLDAAKAAPYRMVNFVCLKNRAGTSPFVCNYFYIPKHHLFVSLNDDQAKDAEFKSIKGLSKELATYATQSERKWKAISSAVDIQLPKA